MEGVAHRNENCNVCMCILFPWSPISPTWMGSSQKWELQCLYVYIIPLITYFPKHGWGCSQKWELQCMCILFPCHLFHQTWRGCYINVCMCILFLDHLFPQHGWVAHRNENCNVCMCILFPWSPISPTWRGCSQQWELQCIYVYYSLDHLFPNMERVAQRNENCNVCMCILFPWSPISPTWRGCSQQWELQCIYVYYSLDHLFSRHGGGCWEKWELQCLYVYIIPLITYFPNMEGVAHRKENCNVCMRIAMLQCICILFPWSPIFPTWRGLLTEMRIAMSVCVYYSLGHLFPQTWRGLLTEMRIALYICILFPLSPIFPWRGLL